MNYTNFLLEQYGELIEAKHTISQLWTDDEVKEFCRVYTVGSYTKEYYDCKTIDEKMKRFKELKNK